VGGEGSNIGLHDCVWGICLIGSFLFQLVKAIKVYGKGQYGGVSLYVYIHTYIHTDTSTLTASESFQLIHHNFRRDYLETEATYKCNGQLVPNVTHEYACSDVRHPT
jgi:hypothetical protein